MSEKPIDDVSEKDFKTYETIRESGVTNMFDVAKVQEIAEEAHDHPLDRDTILAIMNNYAQCKEEYGGDH